MGPPPDPGQRWCTVHRTVHPEEDFAWKDRAAGIRQSRCRNAQATAARASYQRHRDDRIAAVRSRRDDAARRRAAELRRLCATTVCVDCGATATTGLVAEMPPGYPTPAAVVRRGVTGVDLAELVGLATWRCRACAGARFGIRRRARMGDAVAAAIASGGEWTVHQLMGYLNDAGITVSTQGLRNQLAGLAKSGAIERFDRGVYRQRATRAERDLGPEASPAPTQTSNTTTSGPPHPEPAGAGH